MNITRPDLPSTCRIICISDIHAYLDDFKLLLEECSYDADADYLFILGDIIERGPQSTETLNYVQELCKNPKVIFIQGNNDAMLYQMAYTDDKAQFLDRLVQRPGNTFTQMAESLGITDFNENFEQKRKQVTEANRSHIDFIQKAPFAIETRDFIFVHAGIENRPDWENSDPNSALAQRRFMHYGHQQPKTVICGHYPTYNFRNSNNTNLPLYDRDRRIIDIDGGMGTKPAMQLNALVIYIDGDKYRFQTLFHPHGEEVTVTVDTPTGKKPKYTDWENHCISVIEDQGEFLLVKNDATNETGLIPEFLTGTSDGLRAWIYLDAFVSVKAGEKFCICQETENHVFGITEKGKIGFIPRTALIPVEENAEENPEETPSEEADSEE